jgi:hypothetical protein
MNDIVDLICHNYMILMDEIYVVTSGRDVTGMMVLGFRGISPKWPYFNYLQVSESLSHV